jgi:hypothetical protein
VDNMVVQTEGKLVTTMEILALVHLFMSVIFFKEGGFINANLFPWNSGSPLQSDAYYRNRRSFRSTMDIMTQLEVCLH